MSFPLIRTLVRIEEIHAAVDLQKAVWQTEDRDLVPVTEIVSARENGGIVLGAHDGDRMVGFVFSMVGRRNGQSYQYSRMLAVEREWRGRGVGAALKLAQRDVALAAGDTRMEWTFDPLEGRNAALNLRRLGARVRHYYRDFYGARTSRFDLGIPTDRLRAEWDLAENLEVTGPDRRRSVAARIGVSIRDDRPADGPGDFHPPDPAIDYRIPVPIPFQPIREEDPALAMSWRISLRTAFEAAFALGFEVIDFESPVDNAAGYGYYRLRPTHGAPT